MYGLIEYKNLKVLEVVVGHLKSSILFTDDAIRPVGGIWIKPKPKKIREKLLEVNLLAGSGYSSRGEKYIFGHVNINFQDEDIDWVTEISEIIGLVMDDALVKNYYFERENDLDIFNLSAYLYMGNVRYRFTVPKNKIRNISKRLLK